MSESVEIKLTSEPKFNNIAANKKRSKRRDFNEYSLVTDLVRKYKESNDQNDLLDVLKALEGIINSFTIILTPGDANQQIYLNPFMKKFLGMFLSPQEIATCNNQTYMQAVYRVRWLMRYHTYEDIYAKVVEILIQIIQSMKIMEKNGKTCECIYYIQLISKYKMHDYVAKQGNDAMVDIKEMPTDFASAGADESLEDTLDRLSFDRNDVFSIEDKIISDLYDDITPSVLIDEEDIFKCFSHYEKFIIYMHDYLGLTNKKIISILKYENADELQERIDDIRYKLELINQEGD